ncbi:RbsD/FucU family protein [Paracoccus contaminans]|uniref:Ribose ABC transporter n=1 Tax=Paracoccus contaminans TaxID=1945662 RepID=A0A1W6CXZ8_9RHOB|nr:RbsD/FucU domain-containing protein [Paracoccus contaminans]ARJ69728.1 ribose ABC transporter [Paracoccus contaminans]
MLKGIDPLIGPDLLRALALMGHGDAIAIVDANFPAESTARRTPMGTALRMDCDCTRAVRAVLSLLPIDSFGADPVRTMQMVDDASAIPPAVAETEPLFAAQGFASTSLERFAFYSAAQAAFIILRTAETRPYGNFLIRKGVVALPCPAG